MKISFDQKVFKRERERERGGGTERNIYMNEKWVEMGRDEDVWYGKRQDKATAFVQSKANERTKSLIYRLFEMIALRIYSFSKHHYRCLWNMPALVCSFIFVHCIVLYYLTSHLIIYFGSSFGVKPVDRHTHTHTLLIDNLVRIPTNQNTKKKNSSGFFVISQMLKRYRPISLHAF